MFELLTNLNGFKKNKDGGIDMSENKKEVIPMYTRIQNLYNKLDILKFDCTLVKEGFKAHKLEQLIFDYFIFNTNLGERLVHINEGLHKDCYDFIYYDGNQLQDKQLFKVRVWENELIIERPNYKIGQNQITPEQINDAIKEIEDKVNAKWENYLYNKEYHKKQEEKLASL